MTAVRHSVFVIDDDAAVRDSLLHLLRSEGIRARGFASGGDFFANLPEDRSACVVTDMRMPGMDGSEVVRRLNQFSDRAWPVIVFTGHADVPMAVQLMKAGVIDFIEKPFKSDRLVVVVERALEAASLKIPAINVGKRQRGRLCAGNVIFTDGSADEFNAALLTIQSEAFQSALRTLENPYGNGRSSELAAAILTSIDFQPLLKKPEDPLHANIPT